MLPRSKLMLTWVKISCPFLGRIVPLHKLRHLVATSRKQAGERIEHWSSDSILQVMYGRVARAALIVTAGQVILHVLLSVHTRHFQ